MPDVRFEIPVRDKSVPAIQTSPDKDPRFTFVYAPGAGSNINDPFGEYLSSRLPAVGASLVRFQFPYMEAGRRGPDRPPLLEETWLAVLDRVRSDSAKLVVGGRSMGGRIASHVVAQGAKVDGLALFAYPLKPPRNPSRIPKIARDEHLITIDIPTLFCSGTRDTFATPEDLMTVAGKMNNAEFQKLEGADHGFSVLKSSGMTRDDVWREAADAMLGWVQGFAP